MSVITQNFCFLVIGFFLCVIAVSEGPDFRRARIHLSIIFLELSIFMLGFMAFKKPAGRLLPVFRKK